MDIRTPTGDESNLLGTGGVQTKVFGILSTSVGRMSPHVNVGYTASTKGALRSGSLHDEWNYAAGFDLAASPRLTLIADVLGRSIRDLGRHARSRQGVRVHRDWHRGWWWRRRWGRRRWRGGRTTTTTTTQVTRRELRLEPGNLNVIVGNAGVRFNPVRTFLISASLLFNLTNAGLRDRVTPVISIDYAF